MRRAALTLFGTLVLALIVANPAAASCTVHDGDVGFELCDDQNGNVVPDHAAADTPVGGFAYHEAGCSDCPGASGVQGSFAVADLSLDAKVMCHGAIGQPQYDCWFIRAMFDSPVAHSSAGNIGGGPPDDFCYKIIVDEVPLHGCVNTPDS